MAVQWGRTTGDKRRFAAGVARQAGCSTCGGGFSRAWKGTEIGGEGADTMGRSYTARQWVAQRAVGGQGSEKANHRGHGENKPRRTRRRQTTEDTEDTERGKEGADRLGGPYTARQWVEQRVVGKGGRGRLESLPHIRGLTHISSPAPQEGLVLKGASEGRRRSDTGCRPIKGIDKVPGREGLLP